jgi:hypothetical protein
MIAGKPVHSLLSTPLYSYHHVFPVLSFGLDFFLSLFFAQISSDCNISKISGLSTLLPGRAWIPLIRKLDHIRNIKGTMSQVTPGKAQGTDSQTFLTALITNASVLVLEVAAFVLLRSRLWRIYEPRTYLPPPGYASPAALLVRS